MKTDKEIRDEFANGATSVDARKNSTNEGTIYVFNMDTWNTPELIHKSTIPGVNQSLNHYVIPDKESNLGKPNIFLSSTYHSSGGGRGALMSLKVAPNIINNENIIALNTVQIDKLLMKNDITGNNITANNVKLHPITKGVVLDISGDNTGSGTNGVLINLNSSGTENTAGSMIRFSNANK